MFPERVRMKTEKREPTSAKRTILNKNSKNLSSNNSIREIVGRGEKTKALLFFWQFLKFFSINKNLSSVVIIFASKFNASFIHLLCFCVKRMGMELACCCLLESQHKYFPISFISSSTLEAILLPLQSKFGLTVFLSSASF